MRKRQIPRSLLSGLLTTGFALSSLSYVDAGWPEFKQECHTDKLRNNAWPQPFRGQDAASVVAPFEVMKANGWREFNTLSDSFFDVKHQLTDAGLLKLHQTLIQSPTNRRAVFVLKADSAEQTASRVEAVEVAVSGMIPTGDLPPIYVTDINPTVSSGVYQTMVNRALIKTTPSPRVPAFKGINEVSAQTVAPNAGQASGK